MKNRLYFFATAMCALAMVACSKSIDNTEIKPATEGYPISISATIQDDNTRTSIQQGENGKGLKTEWLTTDRILVYVGSLDADHCTVLTNSSEVNGTAVFSGTLPVQPTAGTKIWAYAYYGSNSYVGKDQYRYHELLRQNGTLENVVQRSLLYADGEWSDNLVLNFKYLNSVWKLIFTFPDDIAEGTTVSDLGLTATTGLYITAAYDATNGYNIYPSSSLTASSLTALSATIDSNHQATIWLVTAPGTVTNIYGTATIGGASYVSDTQLAQSLTLQAGVVYAKSDINMVQDSNIADRFAGGTGTADDPYQISNIKELRFLSQCTTNGATASSYSNKCYKLTNSIDLGDGSIEWTPIGDQNMAYPLSGTIDGDGHTIYGTMKMSASQRYGGLVSYTGRSEFVIKNINMNCTIDASSVTNCVGALVGYLYGGSIINCTSSGNITANSASQIGGIAGFMYTSSSNPNEANIIGCTNSGTITASSSSTISVGGILGESDHKGKGHIVGCINKGDIIYTGTSSNSGLGGITGFDYNSSSNALSNAETISCWSTASQTSSVNCLQGTIIGRASKCRIDNCYYKAIGTYPVAVIQRDAEATNCGVITGDVPSAAQIEAMNAAWATYDSARQYRFNATTGEVEKIQ